MSENTYSNLPIAKPKILVAEDDKYNMEIIVLYLSHIYCEPIPVLNGLEAINAIEKDPEIRLILMDIHMPIVNGLEATAEIKKVHPDLPIVIVTASFFHSDLEIIKDSGADDILIKPYSKSDLLLMVNKYLKPFPKPNEPAGK